MDTSAKYRRCSDDEHAHLRGSKNEVGPEIGRTGSLLQRRFAENNLLQDNMEYYWELIAALKVRTSNKKGRHLSPGEAIRLFEQFGVEIPELLIKAQKSMFKTTSVNRYLLHWGYDHETLHRQSAAVRFVAGIRCVTPGGQQTSRFTWRTTDGSSTPTRWLGMSLREQ